MDAAGVRVVCEVGPGTLRVLDPPGGRSVERGLIEAILDAGGELLALHEDRPVGTAALWRTAFDALLEGADEALLVHPSWWSPARLAPVVEVARQVVGDITTCPRYQLLHRGAAFIEVAPDFVAFGAGEGIVGAETRCSAADLVAEAVYSRIGGEGVGVHIDAPAGVPGAAALGSLIARRIRTAGRPVRQLAERDLCAAAKRSMRPAPPPPVRRSERRPTAPAGVLLGAVVLTVITVAGVTTSHGTRTAETELVEGRVAVRIPADWPVQRVTGGSGSARVQVLSPDDPDAILHITQSSVPTDDLMATATALWSAVRAQPEGVFVDFDADDRRAGRPAVTYREVRPGRDIRWTVMPAGRMRISIGCQSAPGRTGSIEAVCEQAIRSAREIS